MNFFPSDRRKAAGSRTAQNARGMRVDSKSMQTTGDGLSDIAKLMHDFRCSDPKEMYFDVLRKQVEKFKNSEEGRRTMCEAMEKIRARGKREGKRANMLATAKRLLANGKLMLKEIAECTGLSLAQVKKLQASMV